MKITEKTWENVDINGYVDGKSNEFVLITTGAIKLNKNELWITIISPRTPDGKVKVVTVLFRDETEWNKLMSSGQLYLNE